MGNPCTKLDGYRLVVIAFLPQLKVSEGEEEDEQETEEDQERGTGKCMTENEDKSG